ncbi:N-acetylglucosamine-6-phosphate deacetylase [Subtercola sp. PAMC28395]|uniref:N-acetylglucosamine-6-phosphate deacetylase n=1 Tax=Subtercola sp. PAMC28395 TaxID=2846775 RepID=UPI001C0AD068|nr:N-acetylglucosamine-6-phosphate deacetylase [Subtercola sp. PAMC28395]QWT24721.1 N-acetylglucosamine-6-phosphate deacetylase [Subtercola sp. PAMC28395]
MGILVHGARKVDCDGIVGDFWFATDGSRIVATGTGDDWRSHYSDVADRLHAGGRLVTPGFVDIHCHGGGGYSFEDGPSAIRAGMATHRAHGTTRTMVSFVAGGIRATLDRLSTVARLVEEDPLILGSHLEGPFLAPTRRGAHAEELLATPDEGTVSMLLEAGGRSLCQTTIAPELPGAIEAITVMAASGVTPAVGHTNASEEVARAAFDAGARILTHAFNAMPGISHREPGPIIAAAADPRVTLEVIADGHHIHPDVVRAAFLLAPGRIALVTDAMAAAGAPDGPYRLGSLEVDVREGVARVRGSETLAGSTLTLDSALRYVTESCGIGLAEAVRAVTATPATAVGRSGHLGRLAPGYLADAVILSESLVVERVLAGGRFVL